MNKRVTEGDSDYRKRQAGRPFTGNQQQAGLFHTAPTRSWAGYGPIDIGRGPTDARSGPVEVQLASVSNQLLLVVGQQTLGGVRLMSGWVQLMSIGVQTMSVGGTMGPTDV